MKKLSITVLIDFIVSLVIFIWILSNYLRQTEDGRYSYTLEDMKIFFIILGLGILIMLVGVLLRDERPHMLSIVSFLVAIHFAGPYTLLAIVFVVCAIINVFDQRKTNKKANNIVSDAVRENRIADASTDYDSGSDE